VYSFRGDEGVTMDAMTIEAEALAPGEIAEWLTSVASDPVRFVAEGFAWGEGELKNSSGPEPWQRWLLEQIRDGLMTPGQAIRIAVASGHGIGKSAVCSWITLWAMSTAPDTRGIITASSEAMLYTRFRAELRVWFRRFRAAQHFEMSATSLLSRDESHSQTWRIDLLAWNANRPEAFAGLHNKGRRILVIFDEASAIEAPIWETVEAIATDADAECIWICCGNPLHATGRFRDCFDRYQHRWVCKHVDSRTISFTNQRELQRWIDDYGIDSDFVRARILGEFPRTGAVQFIGDELVTAAMARELDPSYSDPLVIGIDVARFGDDCSVIFPRKGMDCRSIAPLVFRNLPLDRFEDHIVQFCNAHPVQQLLIDGTGLGGGLVDHLRRRGYLVTDIQFGGKADQEIDGVRYANRRASIWGAMRHALRYLCLPTNNQALREQLCAPQYSFSRTGDAILLEAKDMMKRRGVPSPNLADALACTFGAEVATLPALAPWVQGRGAAHEYNPFDEDHMRPPAPQAGGGFVDSETGYAFRMKKSEEWSWQDHADAQASDGLRSQPAPEPYSEPWPSSGAGRSLWPKLR
jgi:hypothetical protein